MSDSSSVTGHRVIVGGQVIEIPRGIEAEGAAAIDAYVAEQLEPDVLPAPEPIEE